jgi:haloalkane dehalogenase
VAENPERFSRIVVTNTGLPTPGPIAQDRIDAVVDFRENKPTPTLPEVMAALSNAGSSQPEMNFAHWQKWTWETEDIPVGMMIMASVDGRTLTPEEVAAYDAPFPDPSYKMGPRAMPSQVPTLPDDPSIAANRRAWESLCKWEEPLLCAFSDNDPVTAGGDQRFRTDVPGAAGQPHVTIEGGGHFLQEGRGEELARIVVEFVKSI